MGQYYIGTLINATDTNKIKTVWPHHFDCGAKLTEFSWIGNYPMQRAALELINEAHYVAYIGDYADDAWNEYRNKNKQSLVSTKRDYLKYYRRAWQESNRTSKDTTFLIPTTEKWLNGKIAEENISICEYDLINYSKGIYIDLAKYAEENTKTDKDGTWTPNPISLLTAVGNGNGGGDYYKEIGKEHIGTWAFDLIKLGMHNATLKEVVYHFDPEM